MIEYYLDRIMFDTIKKMQPDEKVKLFKHLTTDFKELFMVKRVVYHVTLSMQALASTMGLFRIGTNKAEIQVPTSLDGLERMVLVALKVYTESNNLVQKRLIAYDIVRMFYNMAKIDDLKQVEIRVDDLKCLLSSDSELIEMYAKMIESKQKGDHASKCRYLLYLIGCFILRC